MTDKSQKIAKILLAAGGAAIGILLIAKYRKNILRKFHAFQNFANLRKPTFQVEIINSDHECESIIQKLRADCTEFPAVGFDCEWVTVNSSRRKIALIQVCSSQGLCALFRVFKFHTIPSNLRQFLEDPEIIKTGVTPCSDAKYLQQDYSINMNSTFDLRFLALIANHKAEGLGKLSKSILNVELDKDWRIRCSDWEIENMSSVQVDYAAKDAFVAIEIFRKLYTSIRAGSMDPHSIRRFCDNYTDITFKNKLAQMNLDPANETKLLKVQKGNLKNNNTRGYTTRATPLYHNCQLQAPDGILLASCDRQKAEWYVKKGLGVEIEGAADYTVRLNFEPAGRAEADYYKAAKENRCVVCGETENLIRKNIVPHEYRKFFPKIMKEKTSHDVLLLCVTCHRNSNICDLKVRQKLEESCEAPIDSTTPDDAQAAKKLRHHQRLGRALLYLNQLPDKRKKELKDELSELYPGQEISEEFLQSLVDQECSPSGIKRSHGELVCEKFKNDDGLVALEKVWREHFLKAWEPKFMPELWNLDHNVNRLTQRAIEGRIEQEDLNASGVKVTIVPKIQPEVAVTAAPVNTSVNNLSKDKINESEVLIDDDSIDNSSEWDFRSAAGSRASSIRMDLDKTLTEDERYYSDVQSYYETIRSDSSTLDDFQSFTSSLTERQDPDSDEGSQTSLKSDDFPIDSDTEVEEDPMDKMEM